ncbi:hypothetical protein IWQ47_002174 [Aquimarina sp. EL_43]|uniref:hypothetical protein n=1 Tax=Aquimarina TaxID=290174 RepID=UPI00046F49F9|nr:MULTISPECIES: hypothetical protein [Aquimarina]MBG6130698.1 hypothetical protein [Aquimarina sp. EL_35]MBG6151156.1 hypothetical protein [Aquimarina sp. EL_32]MBG6169100.1 hypothetical protein [Aquimarina sp. EL_43]
MKVLLIIVTFFFLVGDTVRIEDIRNAYKTCNESKEKTEQFYELTQKGLQNKGAIYRAYHGAALALKASFSWNPFSKISYFNKAKKMIEEAILSEPNNIELRMIRLSIQANTPKIADYYKNLEEDKDYIFDNIDKVDDKELKLYIENFIAQSSIFSD